MLRHDRVEQVFTPAAAHDEVFEYLPSLARKKRLDLDTLLLACAALPIGIVERSESEANLSTARRRIGRRDPDDIDVLALALTLKVPVWSNDKDRKDQHPSTLAIELDSDAVTDPSPTLERGKS